MEIILYPPRCPPLDEFSLDSILIEGLQKILSYFTEFSHQNDNIYKYRILWSHINEIAKVHQSPSIALLATCVSVELCRNFVSVPAEMHRYTSPEDFRKLYSLVTKFLGNITTDSFVLKYNLLRKFVYHELFRLDHFSPCMELEIANEMFLGMFKSLTAICRKYDATEDIHQLGSSGIRQLLTSAGVCVDVYLILKEFLTLLLTGNPPIRYMAKECIGSLKFHHFQTLCRVIVQRVTQKTKSEIFNGKELIITEKTIMIVSSVQVFESIIYVIQKESLNSHHPDQKQIVCILCALIVRYTEETKQHWKSLELELKHYIHLMISKFLKVMTRPTPRPYTSILQKYGALLLQNAPDARTKLQYFKLFQHYTKITTGKTRQFLGNVYEDGLNNCKVKSNHDKSK